MRVRLSGPAIFISGFEFLFIYQSLATMLKHLILFVILGAVLSSCSKSSSPTGTDVTSYV